MTTKFFYGGFNVYPVVTIIILWVSSGVTQKILNNEHNEFCKPRPTLVALDDPSYRIFPFFVSLQRCGGSAGYVSPRTQYCAPNTTEDVKIEVTNFDRNRNEIMVVKNHTTCVRKCVNTEEMCDPDYQFWKPSYCSCECKYSVGPPEGCPVGFRWNKHLCKCECDSLPNAIKCLKEHKVWNDEMCGCSCPNRIINRCKRKNKDLDENNCECIAKRPVVGARQTDAQCISKGLLFGIMLGELILLLLLVDICLYMKGLGLLYHLKGKSDRNRKESEKLDVPRSPSGHHDTTTYI